MGRLSVYIHLQSCLTWANTHLHPFRKRSCDFCYDQGMPDRTGELFNATAQTQLTPSARDKLWRVAAHQHLKPSALLRLWAMQQLDKIIEDEERPS